MAIGLHPPIQAGPAWQYSFLNLSIPDILVVATMLIIFIVAIALPFPGDKS
ncbi:hypothetical protein [Sulfoacidibacillus ferrooxidans]|uniref:Uncharacterized protein n=1 Tax=Sulfoacidibacillus ferrooxidans TaxID=2005001 RepID=A0A9X1VAW9_9BACL|nr:hypothetical protein [Sulfoacidibacillus ferrooxidans]MCI0184906.1 hypothetical protein [Sulfoacidibacillus ferrooxidans]